MPRPPVIALSVALAAALAVGGLAVLPAGAAETNLALNRPVAVSSSESSSLGGAKAVDGSTSSRWASVEGHDPEWLRVDLGATYPVTRVLLRWEAAYAKSYRVEVSDDTTTWRQLTATTTGNGGSDDLTGLSGSGRYVRVYGTQRGTAYGYSLFEVEVYGGGTTPTPTASPTTSPTVGPSTPPPTTQPPGGPAVPFGSHLYPYVAGTLRPSGSQATVDQAVVTYYQKWKNAFVRQNCGNGWYEVISPDADHPYVAEAQGYGMVIVATMAGVDPDAKKIFDGMVKFMLAHPSVNNKDLLAAEQDAACKSVSGSDSATDGDMDVAYGLLLASKQWGNAGTYNYQQLAIKHINAIKASEINPSTNLLTFGDWSTPGEEHYYMTRPSDHMIDHFRAFRKATGDSAWDTIRQAHQTLTTNLQNQYSPNTGLLPDFVINTNSSAKPAQGKVLEDPNDGYNWWNSCRTPWRLGADAAVNGDAASRTSARKLTTWIRAKTGNDPSKIAIGYKLDGTQISSGSEPAFFAPYAVAAINDPGAQTWVDSLWSKMLATQPGTTDYYSTSIQLQTMIVVSGNYWQP
ncbi:glycosyl hydrolase family 8 [Longispora urticae]